jgi:hypothetical protein
VLTATDQRSAISEAAKLTAANDSSGSSGAVVSRESGPSRTDRRQPKPEVPHVELTSSKLPLNSMPYLTSTVSA